MITAGGTMTELTDHAARKRLDQAVRTPQHPQQLPDGVRLTAEQLRARSARSVAIALALGAFVVLIFAVTIVRLGANVAAGPDYMRPVQTDR